MADAQNAPATDDAAQQAPEQAESRPSGKKKKKPKKGRKLILILFVLFIGACVGLQISGGADLRPFVYPIIPKLPLVGESLTEMLNVPAIYSLTPEERRKIELDEWEMSIAERTRSLDVQGESLDALSQDLYGREAEISETQRELQRRLEALDEEMARGKTDLDAEGGEIAVLVRTFSEMSPKNAASIIEKLSPALAVTILDSLDTEFRAKTLGRMEADTAAMLIDRLKKYQAAKQNEAEEDR